MRRSIYVSVDFFETNYKSLRAQTCGDQQEIACHSCHYKENFEYLKSQHAYFFIAKLWAIIIYCVGKIIIWMKKRRFKTEANNNICDWKTLIY